MSSKKFRPVKDFQSDQIQRSNSKIFHRAHYAYRNADLNLTLVTGTTNGFKLNQFINRILEGTLDLP